MGIKLLSSLVGSENTGVVSCCVISSNGMSSSGLTSHYVPINTTSNVCGLHIGDGIHGLFVGNATSTGFVPKILGKAFDITDAGLYFIGGVSGDSGAGGAIALQGRNADDTPLTNRALVDYYN